MRYAALMMMLALAACSGDGTKGSNNDGWTLGDDAGNNSAGDASSANNVSSNSTTSNSTTSNTTPANNGTTPANNTSTNTTGSTTNTNAMTTGNGMLAEGDTCTLNSQCQADLTCCMGFDGAATCSTQCFGGGLCGGNPVECSNGDECCDLSAISQPDTCLQQCRGGGNNGNPGIPCANNTECTVADEVCCLGFDGEGECTSDCFTGGACEVDAECRNGQVCCDISVAMVCLDQCNF